MNFTTLGEFDPLRPDSSLITIESVSRSLGRMPRFNGHAEFFYSVGTHSIAVAERVPRHLALPALLHDAHEAFTGWGDITRYSRLIMPDVAKDFICRIERRIDVAVADAFGFDPDLFYDPAIKAADDAEATREIEQFFAGQDRGIVERGPVESVAEFRSTLAWLMKGGVW